jgi:hypothetical protein
MEELRMPNNTKRIVILFMIYCLISVAALPLSNSGATDGGDRGFGPMATGDPWTDNLDDTSQVFVPHAGLVGIEVSGGDAHLKAGDSTGWIASEIITVPDGYRYDLVLLEVDTPGNSYVELSVLNASADPSEVGFANESIGGFKLLPVTDLSIYSISPKLFPKIRIQVNLHADGADRPRLLAWTVYFIGLEEWRDDFMGAGKMSDQSGLNFTGDILEVNLSSGKTGGGGVGDYEAFPTIATSGWYSVSLLYPNAGHTAYLDDDPLTPGGSQIWGIDMGDVNGDGYFDIVTADRGGDSNIYWGSTSGTYSTSSKKLIGANNAQKVAIGDYNGDGEYDLAFAVAASGAGDSLLWLNQGSGTFNAGPDITFTGKAGSHVSSGDVNGDGYDDVILSYTNIDVFFGGPSGPDTTADKTITGAYVYSVADVDHDGYDDLLARRSSIVSIYLGSASGPVTPADYSLDPTGAQVYGLAAGDINGDGYTDIVTTTYVSSSNYPITIYEGSANGWTDSRKHEDLSTIYGALAAGDIDKDGYDDIAWSEYGNPNYKVSIGFGGTSWPTAADITKTVTRVYNIELAIPKGDGGKRAYRGSFTTT